MIWIGFEQASTSSTVQDADDLTIPSDAQYALLQASGQHASITMDDSTDPTQTKGLFLLTTMPPYEVTITQLQMIRFVRAAGSDGKLNIAYIGSGVS